jgi:hypothetical protein
MDQKDTDGPTSVDGSPNSDHRATQHERARLSAKGMSLVEEDSFKGIPQKRSALGFECVSPKYIGVPTEAIASFCILITLANDRVWMCLGKKEIPDPASLSHTFSLLSTPLTIISRSFYVVSMFLSSISESYN